MFQLVAFVALAYSVDIYHHYPSSLFYHSVKADFNVIVMML